MTDREKQQIALYRKQGLSYTVISKKMDLSINSIKTYCKRHGLCGIKAKGSPVQGERCQCENCGKPITQNPGRKKKRFCSDRCRNLWWNGHLELVERRANYEYVCVNCGRAFTAYAQKERKYCCHECYIADRFGGGGHE